MEAVVFPYGDEEYEGNVWFVDLPYPPKVGDSFTLGVENRGDVSFIITEIDFSDGNVEDYINDSDRCAPQKLELWITIEEPLRTQHTQYSILKKLLTELTMVVRNQLSTVRKTLHTSTTKQTEKIIRFSRING